MFFRKKKKVISLKIVDISNVKYKDIEVIDNNLRIIYFSLVTSENGTIIIASMVQL